jgi:hypothetical protein
MNDREMKCECKGSLGFEVSYLDREVKSGCKRSSGFEVIWIGR